MNDPLQRALKQRLGPTYDDGQACALELYRYAAGDMSRAQQRSFRAHLEGCDHCRQDLLLVRSAVNASDAKGILSRASRQDSGSRWHWLRFALTPAIVAASFMLFVVLDSGRLDETTDDAVHYKIKGAYTLNVAVQRGAQRFSGQSGSTFAAGDVLGFFYTAPEPSYLTLLFSDEQGVLTKIYPHGAASRLPAGIELPLPDGAVLEPGDGCEWIFAVFATQPLAEALLKDKLLQAIRDRGESCELGAVLLDEASVDIFVMRRQAP